MNKKEGLHPKNKHKYGYNFDKLIKLNTVLQQFVYINNYGTTSIDFSNPRAVKELNKTLLFADYQLKFWDFPKENLCPPIPGRVDYIHHLYDLLSKESKVKILDIGTGASCIYPILGVAIYNWNFVATDIDKNSLQSANKIILKNNLQDKIELRFQSNESSILKGILNKKEQFSAIMCNPPFYASYIDAKEENRRKNRNLGNIAVRNFSGNNNELWYVGGEKAFLHTYLYESSQFPESSIWFTSLVSKKENVASLQKSAKKLGATVFKVIPMIQGNKVTRIVAWRY